MNPELICQLASQRQAEVCQEATRSRRAAGDGEKRESVKARAGWALIKAGLKLTGPPSPRQLTGPPSPRQHARPRPAGL
jgi:hypothetical protein